MNPISTQDSNFLDDARRVFDRKDRILIVVRYVYGAGSRDFILLESFDEFEILLAGLKQRDSVIIMKSFDMLTEGLVDPSFIQKSCEIFRPGNSWVLIGPDNYEHTADWAFADSEDELREELEARMGNVVSIVADPNYIDDDVTLGAYVPDSDGCVRPGAY